MISSRFNQHANQQFALQDLRRRTRVAAKEMKFREEARSAMLQGVNTLGQRRAGDARSKRPQRRDREEVWFAGDHQRRRYCGERNRAQRQVRKHGRADGARSCRQDQRHGGRWHHHRDRTGPGDFRAGREECHRRRQSHVVATRNSDRHRRGGCGTRSASPKR